jgi:hypothetical protein
MAQPTHNIKVLTSRLGTGSQYDYGVAHLSAYSKSNAMTLLLNYYV